MHNELAELLKKANTPITNRKVACILITTEGGIYTGYNTENSKKITHAEEMVVLTAEKKDRNFKINSIHLIAGGVPHNVKRSVPCEDCSALLKPHCLPSSKAIFYLPTDPTTSFSTSLKDLIESYSPFSELPVIDNISNSKLKSHLTPTDYKVLKDLIEQLKKIPEINGLYITGSASGRGGPKQILAKTITGFSYWDIDLIALFNSKNKEETNNILKNAFKTSLAKIGFNATNLIEKEVPSYILEENPKTKDAEDFLFRKMYYTPEMQEEIRPPHYEKDPNTPSTIDVSVGKKLLNTATKKYLSKNWLLRLI